MRRAPATGIVLATAAAIVLPAAAAGQVPPVPPEQPPPPQGSPPPAPPPSAPAPQAGGRGRLSIRLSGGLQDRGRRYVSRGGQVRIIGRVRPFVAGQRAVVEVFRRGRRTVARRVAIRGPGAFSVRFTARRAGRYTVRARHDETPEQRRLTARRATVESVIPRAAPGSTGLSARLLKRGLRRLGYAVSAGGRYDGPTARAVLAFRKTNGMARSQTAGRAVFAKLLSGQGGFRLRYPKAGKHVEFDWSRQVLVLADKGRAQFVYHASSGTAATPTVFGRFRFYRKQPGTNSLGMVHSNYFIGGYAIHGYASVPTFPASHGCIRVPIPSALAINKWISLGDRIFVYR